ISVLPRCSGVGEVLEACTLRQAGAAFVRAGLAAASAILTESHISLAALLLVLLILFGLCRSGGIGAMPGVPPMLRRRPEFHGSPLAVRARLGGVATQLAYAAAHCLAHLAAAISLLLLLELAIEVMIKYEGVGRDGYHSLFHVHYDEAFSSLQVPHFKGFLRFHITRAGDLEMFALGLERSPHAWREDPRWRTPHGGGNRDVPAHRAKWVPVEERVHLLRPPRMVPPPEAQLQVVDYLLVPRYPRRG
ncbi:hypothetical protein CHLNCDRAFT_135803, partial [Chlorella variabilis]